MKNLLFLVSAMLAGYLTYAQAAKNMLVTRPDVDNILKGTYTPVTYQASTVISDPGIISSQLVSRISPDSIKKYLFAMKTFQNRNSGSDTVSATRGIGASRRWVNNKFLEFSAANENRLRVAYFQFDRSTCSVTRHRNILAVLPGSQVIDKSAILIEAHIDSRCDVLCDISCNAFGIEDNATGTALVLELARVLSRYTFKNTIIFSIVTGEEQSLVGSQAFADYIKSKGIQLKAVNNNDVSGGTFCGRTSSAPSCPFFGHIDSIGLRIFSFGGFNSHHKQWARYIKLQYKEQVSKIAPVVTDIRIMTAEDRTGRGGDHQPYRTYGYRAVRLTAANENGNATINAAYKDRQHTSRDSLGIDTNGDGVEDSLYVNVNYLARNTLVNGNSIAMAALSPDTITLVTKMITFTRIRVKFNSATIYPAYRVAIRSLTDDWDSVYTITGKTVDTLTLPYAANTNFFISAASVNSLDVESLFSTEYTVAAQQIILPITRAATVPARIESHYEGIKLLQNQPNPFDESTRITILSGTAVFLDRCYITISALDGTVVKRIKVPLKKGVNEVLFNHGYGLSGTYVYSLMIDGLPIQSRKMVFRR